MQDKSLRVLLLADYRPDQAGTLLEHIESYGKFSQHEVYLLNPCGVNFKMWLDFCYFDVVVIHYSICVIYEHFIPLDIERKIKNFKGLKVQFIQDDYRWVEKITSKIDQLGIHLLYSLVGESERAKVWAPLLDKGVTVKTTLTGYVPESLLGYNALPIRERSLHVGYRGRDLPYWLGALSQEKMIVGKKFKEIAPKYHIVTDISWREEDRVYGDAWVRFVASSKAQLGAESGSSITDFNGEVEEKVTEYLSKHPEARFSDVAEDVLSPYEGNVMMNVVSPRVFEAIVLKTALLMFPGDYSDILVPGRHYIVLEKDFSNTEEVIGYLTDDEYLQVMVDRTYEEIVESGRYSYSTFVEMFDEDLLKELTLRENSLKLSDTKGIKAHLDRVKFKLAIGMINQVSKWKNRLVMLKVALMNQEFGRNLVPAYRAIRSLYRSAGSLLMTICRFMQVLGYGVSLYGKEQCIRIVGRLLVVEYGLKRIILGLHLISQVIRVVCLRYHCVKTADGNQRISVRPLVENDHCLTLDISFVGTEHEKGVALNRFELQTLLEKNKINSIGWRKHGGILSGPVLLPETEGVFPLLGKFALCYPQLIALAVFGDE